MSIGDGGPSASNKRPGRPMAPIGTQDEGQNNQVAQGWWLAADERWYPPHLHPGYAELLANAPDVDDDVQLLMPSSRVPPIEWSTSAAISLMLSSASVVSMVMAGDTTGLLFWIALFVATKPIRTVIDGQQDAVGMTFIAVVIAVAGILVAFAL